MLKFGQNEPNLRLVGQGIDRHPLAPDAPVDSLDRFVKTAPVLAIRAAVAGTVMTLEGEMSFQAGDYIVTDYPPTHAWPVHEAIFEDTYEPSDVSAVPPGIAPDAHPHALPEAGSTGRLVYGDGCVVESLEDGSWSMTPATG